MAENGKVKIETRELRNRDVDGGKWRADSACDIWRCLLVSLLVRLYRMAMHDNMSVLLSQSTHGKGTPHLRVGWRQAESLSY